MPLFPFPLSYISIQPHATSIEHRVGEETTAPNDCPNQSTNMYKDHLLNSHHKKLK